MQPTRPTRLSWSRGAAAVLTTLMATACLVALAAPPASSWFESTVSGKVIFNNGAPAPGATVTVTRPFDAPRTTTTDAAGNYHIGNLGPGDYSIGIQSPDGCSRGVSFPIEGRTIQHTADVRLPARVDGYGHFCRATPSPYLEATDQWDLGANGSATVGMPFAFPFYDQSYSTAYISANGFVSFLPLAGSSDANQHLDTSFAPAASVFPFWDDLYLEGTTGVYTGVSGFAPNRRFTIEWRDIILAADAAEGRRIDFEVALYENGAIEFHYRNIDPANHHEKGSFATVGLKSPAGTDYFTYKVNTASFPVADNQPFRFDLAPKCDGVPATVWGGLPLNGVPLRDVIVGTDGPDTINGGGGNDLICAGGGDDQVHGDNGKASPGTFGNDTVFGGDGNDALDGDHGPDTLDGGGGHDTILGGTSGGSLRGGAGNDTLTGREWHDSVDGGEGDDVLVQYSYWADGTDGDDVLDGGPGVDEVRYATRSTPVTIDLADPAVDGGAGEDDQLLGIENARGGSAADTITGDGGTNMLFGGAGVDTLVGGDGADFLYDGSGADVVDGGPGNDVLSQGGGTDAGDVLDGGADTDEVRYAARSTPVTITLADDLPNDGASGEGDRAVRVEDARGGSATDVISGTAGPNRLLGFDGDDAITGRAGDDLLSGGDGDDVLYDGAGADDAHGDGGADLLQQDGAVDAGDVLDGGPGTDEVRYSARSEPVTVNLFGTDADDGAAGEGDRLLEIEDARGGSGADTLQGGSGDNVLHGNAGNDVVNGGGGADVLYDGSGADTVDGQTGEDLLSQSASIDPGDVLDGGAGRDEVRYTARSTAVTLTLAGAAADDGATGEGDQLLDLEDAQGGSAGDVVTGSFGNNLLQGNGGDDALSGGDGADTLHDGLGADTASGQGGDDVLTQSATTDPGDVLDGGEGTDEIRYTARTTPVTLDLGNSAADDGAADELDQLLAFEIVQGGSAGDDITGTSGPDRLHGNSGDDTVDGLDGNDFLYDGLGADTVQGGTGNDVVVQGAAADNGDVLDGGADTDEIRYTARTTQVTIGLATPAADDGAVGEGDQLLAFENAQGGMVSDTITGTVGTNRLYGGTGNDVIDGLEGNDHLYDGPGADTVQGGTGNDVVVQGGTADLGDVLDGGPDTDEIRYAARTTMVRVSLFNVAPDDGALGEGDRILGIENAVGGSAVDHLAGNDGPNRLVGGPGADLVAGFDGNDHVDIADGVGHDQADGGPGTDTVAADPGDVVVGFNP